jgi:hypothetical protein
MMVTLPEELAEPILAGQDSVNVSIEIGTYRKYTSVRIVPSNRSGTNEGAIAQLHGTTLTLPESVSASLELFERWVTWGLDMREESSSLIGLVEPVPVDESSSPTLSQSDEIGAATPVSGDDSEVHLPLPRELLDLFNPLPSGFYISCQEMNGELSLSFTPVSDSDVGMPGVFPIRQNNEQSALAIPVNVAEALNLKDSESARFFLSGSRIIGLLSNPHKFDF